VSELIDVSKKTTKTPDKGLNAPNDEEIEMIDKIEATKADQWFQIAKWAKETNNLDIWKRKLAFSIGKIINRSGSISPKQAKHGVDILNEVDKLGFKAIDTNG